MLCEEKLEVFENGFDDGKSNLRVEFYGRDARKILLAIIRELYLPDYGSEYVYPFECAKEFWGIPLEPEEITEEEFKPNPVKFITQSIMDRLEKAVNDIGAPVEANIKEAEVHRLKRGLLALGKNFVLDEGRKVLFVFNKPSARGLILKYLGMLDED
ncbi:PH1570 family protein [Thermococcus gorgonarius]|uniref:PH1570-like domain-containing protein n=1 Tax=Thermococcus gorgonarius TaxID=71997 RepID=A0A2Z2M8I2_THEGO|nr:PH1570 family protein [Thermococcus gorgonarius]ASJ00712.1 hypothetical protein A3K92_04085 [Thermococcus gorgonarius]